MIPAAEAPAGIQTATGPATSDLAAYESDKATLEMMKNFQECGKQILSFHC
jgi:hypothetical protein